MEKLKRAPPELVDLDVHEPVCAVSRPFRDVPVHLAANELALAASVNLFPVHGHVLRRVDADTHLVALDAQNRERHLVTDRHRLARASRKNEDLVRSGLLLVISTASKQARSHPRRLFLSPIVDGG